MSRLARVLVLVCVAVLPGCKACGKGGENERMSVSVSIFPIYDLVRRVAGPDADVGLLLPPGRSEHAFDPTPVDIEAASRARVGVMVGLGLDPWMEDLMKRAAPKARILKVGDRVPTLDVKNDAVGENDMDGGGTDPHVWLDPARARLIVRAIAEELGKADSAHAIDYRKRATEVDGSIAALDTAIETRTNALTIRGFVTFHASFQYFAERYRLDVQAVIEPNPGTPPSPAQAAKVREAMKANKVPALFSEPQLDPRPARLLADEAKIPLGVLDPIGGGPETDSYEKMIDFDVRSLEKHLR